MKDNTNIEKVEFLNLF